jgi:hypothetical protein
MSDAMPIKSAACNLEKLLKGLSFGESITLTGPEGGPAALLVSLKPERSCQSQLLIGMPEWMSWPER